ncbi:adrenodoxin-like protein 2, mitochondrial isoform X2 [Juglans microcarpa x Juglans regia]|uniref:adrenodoxin-like protein 2, mitochondrial isoform X2 n=1 Tax=Juglans microcarpa x Juglans regia TaxID=2249226 RepID=UPI001B7DD53E|nr:adrenodoxin-like protein 2, mitochondrial isoform X2 [Juglans microcarpa x Juglans regia]
MIMSVPKLSRRVGDWILKELSRGESAPIIRAGHVQRPYSQYLKPIFGRQTETNMFQGALFQKHHHFSTITADTASEVESEENKKISVTFVDKEGEEKQIMVPLGMSMLEAALENDMELEGHFWTQLLMDHFNCNMGLLLLSPSLYHALFFLGDRSSSFGSM